MPKVASTVAHYELRIAHCLSTAAAMMSLSNPRDARNCHALIRSNLAVPRNFFANNFSAAVRSCSSTSSGMSRSIVPLIKGFLDYDRLQHKNGENLIKGIFLNKVSKGSFQLLKTLIEEESASYGVKVIG